MPEITEADREAAKKYALESLDEKGGWESDDKFFRSLGGKFKDLLVLLAAHREAAVAAYIATTTPPEPRELTAEESKQKETAT